MSIDFSKKIKAESSKQIVTQPQNHNYGIIPLKPGSCCVALTFSDILSVERK